MSDKWESKIPPMIGCGNDWTLFEQEVAQRFEYHHPEPYSRPVSIIIPVYNRLEKLGKLRKRKERNRTRPNGPKIQNLPKSNFSYPQILVPDGPL